MSLHRRCSLLLIAALAACAGRQPAATLTPTSAPVTPSATATATMVPTQTATPQPTATFTRTPRPSATPRGFEALYGAGVSVNFPSTWLLLERGSRTLGAMDLASGIYVRVESLEGVDTGGLDALLENLENTEMNGALLEYGETSTITLPGDESADKMELQADLGDTVRDVWLIHSQQAGRTVNITVHGPQGALVERSVTIDRILQSLKVFEPRPFNLPRDETVVLLGGSVEGKHLDPAKATTSAANAVGLLFSGLVRLAPDLSIAPDLASGWTIDDSGTVYTFTLREGIAFSNGTPVTAEMVKDSWERACDPKTGSTTASTYLSDILGAAQRLKGESDTIEGLVVIDERTLQVTLDGPKPYFLYKLTYPTAAVIDPSQVQRSPLEWFKTPHASGPFMLKNLEAENGVIFERNPHYWQPAGVRYVVLQRYAGVAPLTLFEEGMLDILAVSGETLKEVSREDSPLRANLQSAPSMCTLMVLLNPNLAPLDDPLVRQALAQSIDRGALVEKLTANTGLRARGVLPPAMPGARSDRLLPPYDLQAAQRALAQSKYTAEELHIRLVTSGYANSQGKGVALLAEQWREGLGISVTVEYLDPEDYTAAARGDPGHAVLYGWCADYPDPQNFLDVLFHSGSYFNLTGLKDAELDRMLEQARTEVDPAARLALYQEAEAVLLERGYALPLLHNFNGVLVSSRVSGYLLSQGQAQVLPYISLTP
jgi:ABC-type transport system substrate-binding protein